ncbi:MAG: HD domain-containing protein [Armatimonadota bacterium]
MHPVLTRIQRAIEGTSFDGDVFLVGGAVRDDLLGLAGSNDFDLVTRQSAPDLAKFLFEKEVSSIYPVIFERFGTAMVEVDGIKIELVTARKESYAKNSRKPVVQAGTYKDDALRRDFTVNSLMRSLSDWSLIDPLETGVSDLENNVLRTPLEPVKTFEDDPLRMLRAVRFRWKFGLEPAKGLFDAIYMRRSRLKIISFERIRDELSKMLLHPTASEALDDLMKLGLFDIIAPEFKSMVKCEQGKYHHLDVWDHTRLVVKNLVNGGTNDLPLVLSGLFHDIGKPTTRTIDDAGNTRFFGHEALGADMTRQILHRWKVSADDTNRVCTLVKNHMRLGSAPVFSDSAARRLIKDLGTDLEGLLTLVDADANALKVGVRVFDIAEIRETINRVQLATPMEKLASPLTGEEIMKLTGLPPGKKVGDLKRFLDELVLDGQLAPDDKTGAIEQISRSYLIHPPSN